MGVSRFGQLEKKRATIQKRTRTQSINLRFQILFAQLLTFIAIWWYLPQREKKATHLPDEWQTKRRRHRLHHIRAR